MIDCARHLGKTFPCRWDAEKLQLSSFEDSSKRFFVRIDCAEKVKAESVFAGAEFAEGVVEGEIGFVSPAMSEKEYQEKAAQFDKIISMIRVEE